jgi:hypothetical protein
VGEIKYSKLGSGSVVNSNIIAGAGLSRSGDTIRINGFHVAAPSRVNTFGFPKIAGHKVRPTDIVLVTQNGRGNGLYFVHADGTWTREQSMTHYHHLIQGTQLTKWGSEREEVWVLTKAPFTWEKQKKTRIKPQPANAYWR